jgi:DNA-binding FadR family transcriptional regulator
VTAKHDRVARLVRARIERGEFPDGHHLVQGKLAAEYGVHRDVVWQALSALADRGADVGTPVTASGDWQAVRDAVLRKSGEP